MGVIESSLREQSTFESHKKRKKSHHDDQQPRITKDTLLKTLKDLEDEIKKLGDDILRKRWEDLRGQAEVVFENQAEQIENIRGEIQDLKKEVESLKAKIEKLEKTFIVCEVTWVWEAHLARFAVDPSKPIYPSGKFRQMEKYLKSLKEPKDNLWTKIQRTLTDWTDEHQEVVDTLRIERSCIAHPYLIDLDLVESEIKTIMSPESQEIMKDMLDILKMTASLMKFGRLAKCYRHPLLIEESHASAANDIISWDRNFDEIDGLQNIEHEEAKKYLAKYVGDVGDCTINPYYFIVDSIKDENSKYLGKLAWQFEGLPFFDAISTEHGEALEELKKLLPNPDDEGDVTVLDYCRAKLHIPDFLPKRLWKHGIEIVENYFLIDPLKPGSNEDESA